MRITGCVLPARHRGSVDVFLEVMKKAQQGDVLVIDNEGRSDESCVGDLSVLEARARGLAGLVIRGYHRDRDELVRIGFPVFSHPTLFESIYGSEAERSKTTSPSQEKKLAG